MNLRWAHQKYPSAWANGIVLSKNPSILPEGIFKNCSRPFSYHSAPLFDAREPVSPRSLILFKFKSSKVPLCFDFYLIMTYLKIPWYEFLRFYISLFKFWPNFLKLGLSTQVGWFKINDFTQTNMLLLHYYTIFKYFRQNSFLITISHYHKVAIREVKTLSNKVSKIMM